MHMDKFISHLNDPSPGFECFDCEDDTETLAFSLQVENLADPGASDVDLKKMRSKLGEHADEIVQFYATYDGVHLYRQGDAPALEITPLAFWDQRNEEWKEWLKDIPVKDLFDFQREGVAFGEVCFSGNYFIFYKGKVFYADHDDCWDEPLAETFTAFLDKICSDPPAFLEDVGCYTRYEDGKTDTQWVPGKYIPDMDKGLTK